MVNTIENDLFIENKALIYKVIKDLNLEIDKYYDLGMIGFTKALKTYDAKKSKIGTYFYACIKNEILMSMRGRKTKVSEGQTISLNEKIECRSKTLFLEDTIADMNVNIEAEVEKKLLLENVANEINKLPSDEQFIIKYLFGIGLDRSYTQREISKLMGKNEFIISKKKRLVLKRLRARCKKYAY